MAKLWDKGYSVDAIVHRFTVGDDYILDRRILTADVAASTAHAQMLESIGILTTAEMAMLREGLSALLDEFHSGKRTISADDEDCHSFIENYLVKHCGETGKKIHTGRSRNDQVIAALRLWTKDFLHRFIAEAGNLVEVLLNFAQAHAETPMPGMTHMRPAMPSSVGLWAAAAAESLLDDGLIVETAHYLVDQCPLGSAASYGVPLPLDRELTARLLGFSRLQNNVLYVNNSRGKFEAVAADAFQTVGEDLAKVAADLILFTMPEFGFFSLPDSLTTGSSIMPNKKNPDILELVRARAASLAARAQEIHGIVRALPSGYNRDFQATKAPFMRACDEALTAVAIMRHVIENLTVHESTLKQRFSREFFATDAVFAKVRTGMSFREAYRLVAANLDTVEASDPADLIHTRQSTGMPGNLDLAAAASDLSSLRERNRTRSENFRAAITALLDRDLGFYECE